MAGPAAAASPIIAGCSTPNVSMRSCSTSAAPAAAAPRDAAKHNTLPHLIADMEMIREKFGFERWMVVGGSWGATLALAYAQAHPDRVTGIVLRATFLGTLQGNRKRISQRAAALLSRPLRGFPQRAAGGRTRAADRCLFPPHPRSRFRRARARRRGPGARPSAFFPNTRRSAAGSICRAIRRAPCRRRRSWKRIILPTTASCGRTS